MSLYIYPFMQIYTMPFTEQNIRFPVKLSRLHQVILLVIFLILTIVTGVVYRSFFSPNQPNVAITGFETRADGAMRITNCGGQTSCQNPVFSPDSQFILFTRFKNGYNKGPAELVRIKRDGTDEKVIIAANDSDNVNVPFGSWIDNKITWASDRTGKDEIFIANADGSQIRQSTKHGAGSFMEPVFNPTNTNKIIFEFAPSSQPQPHRIKIVEIDKRNKVSDLTNDSRFDDRLPSWSKDGKKILFQRRPKGQDSWEIYVADITLSPIPRLTNLANISHSPSQDTDNSWAYDDQFILSSSDFGNLPVPNIFAFPSSGAGTARPITTSEKEDGAPTFAPDGKWISFESHKTQDENSPANIWIIKAADIAEGKPIATSTPTPTPTPTSTQIWKPALHTSWQIQFTDLPVDQSVDAQMFDIDTFDNDKSVVDSLHAKGKKVVCYIDVGTWEDFRPDANRYPDFVKGKVVSGFTNERWLDIRRIDIIGPIIEKRMDMCKAKGFDGIDPDNIDGHANDSGFPLTAQDQIVFNTFVANQAHKRGLAVGLKNDLGQITKLIGSFEFAINESCFDFNECNEYQPFINAGKPVFQIEYDLPTSQFCSKANGMNFNSLKKNKSLDASRIPCR